VKDVGGDELGRTYRDAFRFAYRMLGHRQEAEDAVQEGFLRLAQQETSHWSAADIRRWVFVVTRNFCVSRLRQRSRHPETPLDDAVLPSSPGTPATAGIADEESAWIRQAILSLPVDMREAIVLREYEQLSYEEIAQLQGCALGTVRSRIARAREALRDRLRPLMEAKG